MLIKITDFTQGNLPWSEFNEIESHLLMCEHCQNTLNSLKVQPDELLGIIADKLKFNASGQEEAIKKNDKEDIILQRFSSP
jgi:uncharacterized protein (UPF0212 family)